MPNPHSVNNYSIGKGILYIAEWSGGAPGAFEDMGNCPSIEVEPTLEELDHFSSRAELREKDKTVVLQSEYTVNFDCDEIAAENLARFFFGELDGTVVKAMTQSDVEYALRFISDNPVGPNWQWDFWRVTLRPAGPMALISEEWMVMSYAATGLSDRANHPTSPYFEINTTESTSTTTTSTTT